jgi:raffinose/stachyose/melibiose transport system substrate-binding protein
MRSQQKLVLLASIIMVLSLILSACTPAPTPAAAPTAAQVQNTPVPQPTAAPTQPPAPTTAAPTAVPPTVAPTAAPAPITLDVWTKYTPGHEKDRYDSFTKIAADFMALHPDITIKHSYFDAQEFKTTVQLAMESGTTGCLVTADLGSANLLPWYQGGLIIPLDNYAKKYGWIDKDKSGAIVATNLGTKPSTVYSGPEIAGLPFIIQGLGVFYNKDVFKQYNETVPTTGDQFEKILADFKAKGITPLVFGNAQQYHGLHILSSLVASNVSIDRINAWWTNSDPTVKFTDPDFLWASQKAAEWAQKGYYTKDFNAVAFDDAMGSFLAGKQPIFITGDWNVSRFNTDAKFNIGFFAFPQYNASIPWTIVKQPDWPMVITKTCKTPDQAAEFLDYLTTQKAEAVWYEHGMLPTWDLDTTGLTATPLLQEVAAGYAGKKSSFYLDVVDSEVHSLMWPLSQQLYDGSVTPADFAKQIQAAREKYLSTGQ